MKRVKSLLNSYGFFVYPLLFALFPLVSFYGSNAAEIKAGDFNVITFLVFNALIGVMAWVASLVLTRDRQKASLLALVFLLCFFTFGRIHDQLGDFAVKIPPLILGPTKLLLLGCLLMVVIGWWLLRKIPTENAKRINGSLNLVSVVMIALAVIPIFQAQATDNTDGQPENLTADGSIHSSLEYLPDIYYILLDSYGRSDYLRDNFEYDNEPFIRALHQKDFYVAEKSNSNYAHTHFSIPSTLNMKYMNYLTDELGETSTNRLPLKDLTRKNDVVPKFQSLGYKYVNISSGWGWTSKSPYSDIEIEGESSNESKVLGIKLDEFALVYLQTTALKPLISSTLKEGLATDIIDAFERTQKVAKIEEPTLTFTHINSPHPPYLFDRNGLVEGQTELELLHDGYSDRKGFADQTHYINGLTLKMIEDILNTSDKPPIIILASDHGPASMLERKDFEETNTAKLDIDGIKERMGILNAYYFPDKNYAKLYQNITPVNSFRVILSQYFGQDLELLPDKSYFSDNKKNEYRMTDVTEIVN